MSSVLITVFTPAFNRAHTLGRTYESLVNQKNKNFEWLIVDDGSTDHTKQLVKSWIEKECSFRIRYIYKENGGMHTAHNVAYENINTELNVCIDSDDILAEDAISKISEKWEKIRDKNYAGIIALDADFAGHIIGKGFPTEMIDTTLSGYYANGGSGDKKLVYRTDIVKKYPAYPVFEGEKYVGLNYKYLLIDQDYKLAVLDDVLCNVDYQSDGSTGTMWRQYLKNPKGFAFLRKEYMKYPTSKNRLFIDCIHYVSSSIFVNNWRFIMESPKKGVTILAIPFGCLLNICVRIKNRKCR